ncbi:unnamed protein product [Toxocara canis]|uniref:Transmembrane protein n=1 Tax=Toxocara canis TaxID=6265 RepID=A0A183VEZ7_TOXCA|nr:unnamed protein product [Toxocara canis]
MKFKLKGSVIQKQAARQVDHFRRYFMALVLKFLLVDLVLTLLLIIGILIHRMHIVPERRRTKIARGMAKAQQQRNMRERAMKRLAKILHPGEQSSSEVAEEVVIAAARQGPATLGSKIGTVVNANERNDALKNVDGALPATPVEGEKAVAAADGKQA